MEPAITYEIKAVEKFELRRIVTEEGQKPRIGYVGEFASLGAAEIFRDELALTDHVEP